MPANSNHDMNDDHRKSDAPSDAAQRIEDKLVEETGKASGDPDKPVQKKWDEMGEKQTIIDQSQRESTRD